MVKIPTIDWSKAPVQPGNPARVPSDGWKNWFDYNPNDQKEVAEIVRIGEDDYLDEWRDVAGIGLNDIAEAAKRAGISDGNARLNEAVARVISGYLRKHDFKRDVEVLDIGGNTGNTSLAVLEHMEPAMRPRIHFTAIDLSREGLEGNDGYRSRLNKTGAHVRELYVGSDLDVLPQLSEACYDIVVETAVRHQHGENKEPTRHRYRVTRRGGILVAGDWHVYDMWKHPARVKQVLLSHLQFPEKERLIEEFTAAYPHSDDVLPPLTSQQERSNIEIARFWTQYGNVYREGTPRPKFRFLEGHRPAEDYLTDMKAVGYKIGNDIKMYTSANPFYLRPDSTLHAVTIGIR